MLLNVKPVKPGVQVRPQGLGHLLRRPDVHERAALGRHAVQEDRASASVPATMTGVAIVRSIVAGSRPIASQWPCEDLGLVPEGLEPEREPVGHVGVLRGDLQRPLLAAATDEDARSAGLDRARDVERLVDPVVGPGEGRAVLGEHRPDDRQRLVEAVHPLADRRELVAVADVLLLVPGRPEPEDRPTAGDDVERRRRLGQERRVAVGHAGHERAQPDPRRLAGERGEGRPALEHRIGDRSDALDLVEVVHHGDEAEPGRLGGTRLLDDAIEQPLGRRVRERVVGQVQAEPGFHQRLRSFVATIPRSVAAR